MDNNYLAELLFGDGQVHMRLPSSQSGWFVGAVKRARRVDPSFPELSPHDLRHTAASLAISAGANVKAVQRMLGHASAAMTLDTYADLFDADLDDLSARMGELLFAGGVGKMWARQVEPTSTSVTDAGVSA